MGCPITIIFNFLNICGGHIFVYISFFISTPVGYKREETWENVVRCFLSTSYAKLVYGEGKDD